MEIFPEEVRRNFEYFYNQVDLEISNAKQQLKSEQDIYFESYRRLTSLNAWRTSILENFYSEDCTGFFLEAQNDALISNVNAQFCIWRTALQALRSCIENVLCTLYYIDHPIELKQWQNQEFKIGFTDLHNYFDKHPSFKSFDNNLNGLEQIKREYATLSKAVHGSAIHFRMTGTREITLCDPDPIKLNQWSAREKCCLTSINCILITFFKDIISGAAHPDLRKSISLCFSDNLRDKINDAYKINIPKLS